MKTLKLHRVAVALLLTVAIIAVVAVRAGPVRANATSHNSCGARGTYGYTGFGNSFDGNPLGLPAGIVSTNGTITLDGSGHWFVREVEVVNGQVVNAAATFNGTIAVNADCTFAAFLPEVPEGPILVGVVVDHGKQIRAMSTIPGVQVNYISTVRVDPDLH
jgi:hypothetical protein